MVASTSTAVYYPSTATTDAIRSIDATCEALCPVITRFCDVGDADQIAAWETAGVEEIERTHGRVFVALMTGAVAILTPAGDLDDVLPPDGDEGEAMAEVLENLPALQLAAGIKPGGATVVNPSGRVIAYERRPVEIGDEAVVVAGVHACQTRSDSRAVPGSVLGRVTWISKAGVATLQGREYRIPTDCLAPRPSALRGRCA